MIRCLKDACRMIKGAAVYRSARNRLNMERAEQLRPAPIGLELHESDELTHLAYALFLSTMPPDNPGWAQAHDLDTSAADDFKLSIDEQNELREFLFQGDLWGDHYAASVLNTAGVGDPWFFLTIGHRSYKTGHLLPRKPFNLYERRNEVLSTLAQWGALRATYGHDVTPNGYSLYGCPHFRHEGAVLNPTNLHSSEMVAFMSQAVDLESLGVICEIGPGDGRAMYELCRLDAMSTSKFILLDHPNMLVRSQFLLAEHLGESRHVAGARLLRDCGNSVARAFQCTDVLCLPAWDIDKIDLDIDLWVNTHSFSEMPFDVARYYVGQIEKNGQYLYSVNDDHDRDVGGRHLIGSFDYLSALAGSFELAHYDRPFTTSFPRALPYHERTFWRRRSE